MLNTKRLRLKLANLPKVTQSGTGYKDGQTLVHLIAGGGSGVGGGVVSAWVREWEALGA